jgi:transcriptional regulator with XRE-family HTH domain
MKKDLAKLIRQMRKALGLNGESQQELLRKIRQAFELTNDELAEALGVPANTLLAYLSPDSAKKHRIMPEADRLVLTRILAERKRGKN